MATASRQDLKDYCLRALGAPVLEINVDEDQLEDRIDEALEYWFLNHHEGVTKVYLKHTITQDDIDNQYIPVNDLIYGVSRVLPVLGGATFSSKNIFDIQYQLRLNDLYDLTSTSIIYYQQAMNHLALLDHVLNGHTIYRFNRLENRLYLDVTWSSDISLGQVVIVEAYRILDPAVNTRMWNEPWLKHYVTALFKKQWGTNLKKFQGLQLPGGVTLDGDSMYKEAVEEINELENELLLKSAPLDFFVG